MFCSRTSNDTINKLQEKSVIIVLNDYLSDFNELLETNNDICNHQRNIQTLLIKVFKMKDGLVSPIMEPMLNRRVNRQNLRNFQEIVTDRKRTVWYCLETLRYCHPQLWSLLPETPKETNSLSKFKRNITQWVCSDCPCKLCKNFVQDLGFF